MLSIAPSQMRVISGEVDGYVAVMGELILASGTLRVSTLRWDFTDTNSVFWAGAAGVVSYGEAPSTTGLVGGPLTVVWSGADKALIAAARDPEMLNSVFNQYLYTFSLSGNQVGVPISLFSGFCEIPDINPDPENPTITLNVEVDSLNLNRPNNYRMTPERLKRDHTGDTFFDYVASLYDKTITAQ